MRQVFLNSNFICNANCMKLYVTVFYCMFAYTMSAVLCPRHDWFYLIFCRICFCSFSTFILDSFWNYTASFLIFFVWQGLWSLMLIVCTLFEEVFIDMKRGRTFKYELKVRPLLVSILFYNSIIKQFWKKNTCSGSS